MNPESNLARAELLIQQARYPQAIELLNQVLASDPNSGRAHSWLALCLAQDRDRLRDATREAEMGVHLVPDQSFSHYILAVVWDGRNETEKSFASVNEAIGLAPNSSELHGLKAHLLSKQQKWQQALAASETGLSYDPEDERCAAIRSFALERLGRVADAIEEAKRAIRQNPDSAHAHASLGWACLRVGKHRESQESFREALRLEPSNEFARAGMVQALNSSNFFFRTFYRIMVWVSRLDSRVQWAMIIGLWLGIRALNSLADSMPALRPWVFPISVFYLLLVMMSWIMNPLFNTFLRFHPFGKHLLSKKEIWASNLIAGVITFGMIAGGAAAYLYQSPIVGLLPFLYAIYLTIPISVAFQTSARWAVAVSITVAACFGLLYFGITGLMLLNVFLLPLLTLFTYGILIYCFAGQALIRAEAKI